MSSLRLNCFFRGLLLCCFYFSPAVVNRKQVVYQQLILSIKCLSHHFTRATRNRMWTHLFVLLARLQRVHLKRNSGDTLALPVLAILFPPSTSRDQ